MSIDAKKFYDYHVIASYNTKEQIIKKNKSVYQQLPVLVNDVLQLMRWAQKGEFTDDDAFMLVDQLNQKSYENVHVSEDSNVDSEGGYFHVQLFQGKLKTKEEVKRIYNEEKRTRGFGLGLGFETSPEEGQIKRLSAQIRKEQQAELPYSFMERTIVQKEEKSKAGRPKKVLTAAEQLQKRMKEAKKKGLIGGEIFDDEESFLTESTDKNSSLTDILNRVREIDANSEFMTLDSDQLKRLFPTVLKGGEPIVMTEEITFSKPLVEPQVEIQE